MKFTNKEIQALLEASYEPENKDVGKFIVDKSLSDELMKVFTMEGSQDVVVIHRGSQDASDWFDNALHAVDIPLSLTKTYRIHLRKQKKVVKKYGKDNIVLLSHSRGALYSTKFYKDGLAKQNITYNKPVMPKDIVASAFEPNDKNNVNIRSEGDLVSVGQNLILNNKHDIVIPSDSLNPITNHNTEQLLKLPDDTTIGSGLPRTSLTDAPVRKFKIPPKDPIDTLTGGQAFANLLKDKIDYRKVRKSELKAFVKLHKAKLGVNITGLTKKQLIDLVEKII